MPFRIEELKKSAARADALTALTRAKAWQGDLDPADLAIGCPSVKEVGSPFSAEDFPTIAREMHPLESKLAEDTNPTQYQMVYDADNIKIKALIHESQDLTPPICKHTFTPDIDPSTLISDEVVFRDLTGIN